jgi:hypothetical protein
VGVNDCHHYSSNHCRCHHHFTLSRGLQSEAAACLNFAGPLILVLMGLHFIAGGQFALEKKKNESTPSFGQSKKRGGG